LEITVAELQSNLDHYLGLVQKGEEVVVSNEGQAIARIQAIPAVPARYTEQERKLVVEGKLIPAKEPMTKEFIEQLSERLRQMEYVPGLGEAARQAIIDDRREGL
jgi:antitoxin (DNA-binding transcriptional repressor) of toxin-antitoxin stability system